MDVCVVPGLTDVIVSPSSVVTQFCDGFSCCPDWELVEPLSFFFLQKGAHCCTVSQEEMRYKISQAKAPPQSRRRMRPPTPLQNSGSSFGEEQGRFEVEDQIWSARERTIIARTKQYLEKRKSIKVNIEELKTLLGPDDSDVDFRRILEEARDKKGCAIFETFSTDGPSKFVVVSRSRWDKHKRRLNAPWRHISSASASDGQWQEGLGRIKLVQSAISVPRKPMFRCDNQCSEKTLSFWQLASVVIKEGEESYTTNLCQ